MKRPKRRVKTKKSERKKEYNFGGLFTHHLDENEGDLLEVSALPYGVPTMVCTSSCT